jgi:hypothetical protein
MKIAYIAGKYPLIPSSGAGRYKKDLSLERASDHQIYGRRLMEQRGFVSCYEIGDPYITEFSLRLSEKLRDQGYATTELAAIIRENAAPLVRYSLLIFKNKPESIIEYRRFIDKTLQRGCIALQLSKDYPTALEPIRHLFAHVLPVNDPDPRHAAESVARMIVVDDTPSETGVQQPTQ